MTERIVAAFVPLVDCAVLVAAREQGFARVGHPFEVFIAEKPAISFNGVDSAKDPGQSLDVGRV